MKKTKIYKLIAVLMILLAINLIWWCLELLFYGSIQHRIVDDIVLLMFVPFIWNSVTVKVGGKE